MADVGGDVDAVQEGDLSCTGRAADFLLDTAKQS